MLNFKSIFKNPPPTQFCISSCFSIKPTRAAVDLDRGSQIQFAWIVCRSHDCPGRSNCSSFHAGTGISHSFLFIPLSLYKHTHQSSTPVLALALFSSTSSCPQHHALTCMDSPKPHPFTQLFLVPLANWYPNAIQRSQIILCV